MAARKSPAEGRKGDKFMRDAIIVALHRTAEDGKTKRLNVIAEKLVQLAEGGDMQAIKEVNDRVDGKAIQVNENHNFAWRASELSDDELAEHIPGRSGDGAAAPPGDSPKPH